MRVTFFPTCVGDRFFAEASADAVRLLRSLGVSVRVPPGATCCGQPAFNAGHHAAARDVAVSAVRALSDGGDDPVVLPSGSCAAMLRAHVPELLDGPAAAAVAARTYELAQFLVEVLGVTELGDGLAGVRVAYHHGCHALRDLGVREAPLTLLARAGADLVSWDEAEECCGFGGLFSVKHPEVSVAMADRKLEGLGGADVLTSADGGCLLQLGGRARRLGRDVSVMHLASLLWRARSGRDAPREAAVGRP